VGTEASFPESLLLALAALAVTGKDTVINGIARFSSDTVKCIVTVNFWFSKVGGRLAGWVTCNLWALNFGRSVASKKCFASLTT